MSVEILSSPIRWIVFLHVIAGATALFILLVPLFSRKGGGVHTTSGWIYTWAMVFVGMSSFIITPWRAIFDPDRTSTSQSFAVFLFYIAVFTLSALWYGLVVLKYRNRSQPSRMVIHVGNRWTASYKSKFEKKSTAE